MNPIWTVGLMTGTVLDGNIDIAMLRTDGETIAEFGPYTLMPYAPAVRTLLEETLAASREWNFEGPEPGIFGQAERALTEAQAEAVSAFVADSGIASIEIGAVGFHGQSVLHRAPQQGRKGATRQLGDGALMHRMLGVPVVFDFRSADVAAGGQGAPLVPAYHQALLRRLDAGPETAVLNLGGVANITWWDGGERLIAFDTGPANAPINDFVRGMGHGEMDRDGVLALSGSVDEARLTSLLEHAYLAAPWPKSLDRFDFSASMADGLGLADGAATLTAFTVGAVGKGLDLLPQRPERLIVCGGGRHNPAIMRMLRERLGVEAVDADSVGWRGDAIEAECFGFLAARVMRGLPISFPTTTGVKAPMTGGRVAGRSR
ncbi:anhydro-N-acetylmuramic acid kinase [Nostoc sp. 3335mG]|nr:anhydro-N-acetylmuramic acid kinase [Nostoc sp. 3335mG]